MKSQLDPQLKTDQTAASEPLAILAEWSEMIKLEHTVFALPFALTGLILAGAELPGWQVAVWTVLAFAGARAAAMTLNRLIDAKIDGLNPRTASRAIPRGRISQSQAVAFAIVCFAVMLFAASQLPLLCLLLSPVAIFWLTFYSFTKRFTWLCHLVLGIALGGAALGGWIAAGGTLLEAAPWILAAAVCTWVTGFDIIYATQDVGFDTEQNLHSIPARFGVPAALLISKVCHIFTVLLLAWLGSVLALGPIFWSGVGTVAVMLFWEHSLISDRDLSRVNAAFFNVNGIVSIAAFIAVLLDKLCR